MAKKLQSAKGIEYLGPVPGKPGIGLYRVRAVVLDRKTGKRVEIDRKVEAANSDDAIAIRLKLRADWLSNREAKREERVRLGDALSKWLNGRLHEMKPSSVDAYRVVTRAWQATPVADYFVDAIDPETDITPTLLGWLAGGLAASTVNQRLRILRAWAKRTKNRHVVEGVKGVSQPFDPEEDESDEGRGLSLDEYRAWLAAGPTASTHHAWCRMWTFLLLLAWTGMRFGEASALEWRDLDLERGVCRVRRSQWRGVVGHPKAKASVRDVPLQADVVAALREHRAWMVANQAPGCDSALVFPSPYYGRQVTSGRTARYLSLSGARRAMLAVCAAAKVGSEEKPIDLDGRPTLHCLRHTVNNLVRQHTSELVRQSIIGHADEKIGQVYSKATHEEKAAAINNVVQLVKGV